MLFLKFQKRELIILTDSMKKKEKDDLFAAHIPGILNYHQTMLADGVRNKLLYEAIKNTVSSETSFLDIGAGSGVWAILAAQLGAKRVVAIEVEEVLIPIIHRLALENGVAGKIEIIHGNSDDVKIRGKFDVVVSELFGSNAFGEATVQSFINLRNRFLAPNGILIPQKLAMFAVPVQSAKSVQEIPAELPILCDFLKALKLNYSQHLSLADRQRTKFLAEPQKLVEIDFRKIDATPALSNLSASWKLSNLPEANAFVVFNYSTFTDEIRMEGYDSQSWGSTVYEFQPFEQISGEIKFNLSIESQKGNWSVSLPSNPQVKMQSYAPMMAAMRLKMAQKSTPHRRFKPPKAVEGKEK